MRSPGRCPKHSWASRTARCLWPQLRVSLAGPSGATTNQYCRWYGRRALLLAFNVQDRRALILISAINSLLAFRVLLAFKAFNQAPADPTSLALAIVAMALVPWSLIVVFGVSAQTAGSPRWTRLVYVAVTLAFVVLTWRVLVGVRGKALSVLVLLVWIATAMRGRARDANPSPWAHRGLARATKWRLRLGRFYKSALHYADRFRSPVTVAVAVTLIAGSALLALRLGGLFLGVRERVPLPGLYLAVSIIYTPLVLFSRSSQAIAG